MACGCAKKRLVTNPKKISKPTTQNTNNKPTSGATTTTRNRRLIRRSTH